MSANNTVTLIGRLGQDPTLRYTGNQTAVCEFSLAVDNRHTSGTDWFKVVAWAGLAETLAEHKTRRPGRRPNAALRVPAGRPAAALDRGFATRRDRF